MTNRFLRTNKQLCVSLVVTGTWRWCLLSWDLLRGNVFRSTRPVSNPICVLHQDVHVPLLVQDFLFRLNTQTPVIQQPRPSDFMSMKTSLSRQTRLALYIYASVCHRRRDSFSNQLLTTQKYKKFCALRSNKLKQWWQRLLCKRNRNPHWVWQPSPWKLKAGSRCHSHVDIVLQGQWLRLPQQQTDGEPERHLLGCLFCRSCPRQRWSVRHPGDCGAAEGCGQKPQIRGLTISKVMNSRLLMNFTSCWKNSHVWVNRLYTMGWKIFVSDWLAGLLS